MIILVGGLPGSGKSFFAKKFAARLKFEYVGSDQTRQALNKNGHYEQSDKLAIYRELATNTEKKIREGKTVVVDATFSSRIARDLFIKLSGALTTTRKFILIYADEATIKLRISKPRQDSEADFEVYKKIKAEYDPIDFDHIEIRSQEGNFDEMFNIALNYISKNTS
jgi:predicted kinase